MEKRKFLAILLLSTLIISVYFLFERGSSLTGLFRTLWGILMPFFLGGVLAFVLNVPLRFFERLLLFFMDRSPGLRRFKRRRKTCSAVDHHRRRLFSETFYQFKIQLRNSFIYAVGCTDGRRHCINPCLFHKFHGIFIACRGSFLCGNILLHAGNDPQFAFDGHISLMGIFCHFCSSCDIFLKRQMRKVRPNAVPSGICTQFSQFFLSAVIQVQSHFDRTILS